MIETKRLLLREYTMDNVPAEFKISYECKPVISPVVNN